MHALSLRLARGLLRENPGRYSVSGISPQDGVINDLDDRMVSVGFEDSSPWESYTGDSHWFKKTLQIVLHDTRMATVGVRALDHQHLDVDTLRDLLASSAYTNLVGNDPGLRVSSRQPTLIETLSFSRDHFMPGEPVPSGVSIRGLREVLEHAKVDGLDFEDFVTFDSIHGTSAKAYVVDHRTKLGYSVGVSANPKVRRTFLRTVVDDEDSGLIRVTTADGSPAQLASFSFDIKPVFAETSWWNPNYTAISQDQNPIIRPDRVRVAEALNALLHAAYERLLNQ